MLNDIERKALKTLYSAEDVLAKAKELLDAKAYEQLEDYLHKTCLMPLGRHDKLPEYLRTEKGEPLFPTNLDPRVDEDKWQAAIEVGWQVMLERHGVSHADIHKNVATAQERDWEAFLESVERRKKERGA